MLTLFDTYCQFLYNRCMKYFLPCFIAAIIPLCASASYNPMFGDNHKNSVSVHLGQGTGPGSLFKLVNPGQWDFMPQTMIIVQNFGYNSSRGLSFLGVGISWDVVPFSWCGFYIGGGLGPYMRDSHDRYVSSRLVFGEKLFIGKNISDKWRAEFFTLHFSNGDFTEINRGFNFTGLAVNYSF